MAEKKKSPTVVLAVLLALVGLVLLAFAVTQGFGLLRVPERLVDLSAPAPGVYCADTNGDGVADLVAVVAAGGKLAGEWVPCLSESKSSILAVGGKVLGWDGVSVFRTRMGRGK
jgi:hypothetical protein